MFILERQVVLLLLRGVCRYIRNIAVRCSIGGYIGSLLFLADVQEVDVLGMNSQLCVRCAVLALPLVNRQSEAVAWIQPNTLSL